MAENGNRFNRTAQGFHWIMVFWLTGMAGLGFYMTSLTYYDPWYHKSVALHESLGLCAFLLWGGRLAWRLSHPPPPPLSTHRPWEKRLAAATHLLLYLLMGLVPVAGYLITTAKGEAVPFFGLWELPALFPAVDHMEDLAGAAHALLVWCLILLAGLHVAGGLKHHFLDRDQTLARMWPWG